MNNDRGYEDWFTLVFAVIVLAIILYNGYEYASPLFHDLWKGVKEATPH